VDVAADDDVGLVPVDPGREVVVGELPAPVPAQRGAGRRGVVDPDPEPGPVDGARRELRVDLGAGDGPVPPRADGEPDAVDVGGRAVDEHPLGVHPVQPAGDLLAVGAGAVEVVVS
jgi:hypothetical protein